MEIRVAAYGRVSGYKDELFRQKATIIQQFSSIIRQCDDWVFSGVFIDIGNSHDQFEDLLELCHKGSIDTIITASMNTLSLRREELYKTLSELKSMNVNITFMDDGLATVGEGGDELLSTLASFLKPVKPPKRVEQPYGIGNEDEAAVVKRVFDLFLSGLGRTPIARILNDEELPPPHPGNKVNCSEWTYCDVRRILGNPIYVKEGLIEKETWERAETEAPRRNVAYGRRPPSASPLTGLITCGICGTVFSRRERGRSTIWLCRTYMQKGRETCPSRCIREKVLTELISGLGDEIDNLTVYPDGRLIVNTPAAEYQKKWR